MATTPARMRTREQTDARIGREMKVFTNMGAGSSGLDGRAVADFLDARDDQLLARLQAAGHDVVVPANFADRDRALARDEPAGALLGDEAEILAADARNGGDRNRQSRHRTPDEA